MTWNHSVISWLESWGKFAKNAVQKAMSDLGNSGVALLRNQSLYDSAIMRDTKRPVQLFTDFSGLEAPLWALRSLDLPVSHEVSCDKAEAAQKWIKEHCHPKLFFGNVLSRKDVDLPKSIDVYVAGFPCQPWSSAHASSRLWRDPNAKQFNATIPTIAATQPQLAILENVLGLKKVWQRVHKHLKGLMHYHILGPLKIDPHADLGEVVRRPRLYIILVHRNHALVEDEHNLPQILETIWASIRTELGSGTNVPCSRPQLRHYIHKPQPDKDHGNRQSLLPKLATGSWHAAHKAFRKKHNLEGVRIHHALGLTRREAEVWGLHKALAERHGKSALVVDVSQSLHRARAQTDGSVPTILRI